MPGVCPGRDVEVFDLSGALVGVGLVFKSIRVGLACVSQKTRKLFGPEKPFVKLRPAYSVKLVFLYVVKGIKIKITAKFCGTEHFRFEDTKRIMSPEKFQVFRETGPWSLFEAFAFKLITTCTYP